MTKITFITGGQRSGKSSFAQSLAEQHSASPIYLATSRHWDDDFTKRILRHQREREESSEGWQTIEEETKLNTLALSGKTVLLDCVTLWLTNIFHDNQYALEPSLNEARTIWDSFIDQPFTLFVVSNEIGMGLHGVDASARRFADLHGWMNQHIASTAQTVFTVFSGIPLKLK